MNSVPKKFKSIFWDTNLDSLDAEKHKRYIIERILEFGDEEAYRWMFTNYSSEEIIEVVKKSRRISRKTAVMMANLYDIPKEEIKCLREPSPLKP
jgi:hypothetical protein